MTGPEQVGACVLAAMAVLLAAHDLHTRHDQERDQ